MTRYTGSRSARRNRWDLWAAFVLGLLFLGLGVPLMAQSGGGAGPDRAESQAEARPNG